MYTYMSVCVHIPSYTEKHTVSIHLYKYLYACLCGPVLAPNYVTLRDNLVNVSQINPRRKNNF